MVYTLLLALVDDMKRFCGLPRVRTTTLIWIQCVYRDRTPGKRHYKGPHKGELSGNPKGKNPGNVWEIPNVKRDRVEKLDHPCQFPVGLADRLVRALCPQDGIVFDPFMGLSSTGVGWIVNSRRFLGAEISKKYTALACERMLMAYAGTVPFRPAEQPIFVPTGREAIARRPEHFAEAAP